MDNSVLNNLFSFLDKAPGDPFTLYSIAYEYKRMQQYEEAHRYFTQLKELHPDYLGLYYHLGATLEQLDRDQDALEVYQQGMAVATSQKDMHALGELKRAYEALKEWEDL